ncbi:LysR family transcriptional regulator [Ancylobacter amanitiformis]|uniref:DNA-binding transcriptional LysR family regulator n=1 Tax=Ancylobacter amanitiformis TaxID=217069 RepID=A0ABU0LUX6_9HYPH|nr:LysR family transcriptional regulator [Ancylobacter amanitiformis]MDQ0512491.1 DNA-binding transcriptional LysR family regulator [Ancylobacter amanitiformis]
MDKLNAMVVLLKVVEAGTLSAAAKQMDVPLATVSRRIAELEAHLKTRMLNRSSRHLSLTEAGRLYVEACRRILEQVEEAERAAMGVHSHPKGRLTITAPIVFGRLHMMPIIAGFLDQYPDIDVKLILADRLLDLLESDVDVALRIGDLGESSLIASNVGSMRRVTCASPSYLAAHGRPRQPEDLQNHVCVTFDNLASPEAWRFSARGGDRVVPVHSRLTVTTAEAAIAGAVAGLGLTRLLHYQITEARRAGQLEIVLEDHELPAWPVSLVYAGQQMLPRKLRAFLDFAAPRLRERLREETATFETEASSAI